MHKTMETRNLRAEAYLRFNAKQRLRKDVIVTLLWAAMGTAVIIASELLV